MTTHNVLYTFFTFMVFLVANHKGPSIESYWDVRGHKNYTYVQLYIPFKFAVAPLYDTTLFNFLYSRNIFFDCTNISSVSG